MSLETGWGSYILCLRRKPVALEKNEANKRRLHGFSFPQNTKVTCGHLNYALNIHLQCFLSRKSVQILPG
jgi:hypothetical protein